MADLVLVNQNISNSNSLFDELDGRSHSLVAAYWLAPSDF